MPTPRRSVLLSLVALAAVVAFFPSFTGPFVFDDIPLIEGNAFVHGFEHWQRWLTSHLWDTTFKAGEDTMAIVFWRPLVQFSYALEWWLGGGSPLPFHLSNLLLHATVSALSFLTLQRWLGSMEAAFVAALIFAVHPSKAESVAWIAGRPDVWCALGVLLVLQGMALRLSKRRIGLAVELLGVLVAYTSKEAAVALPAFVALEAWAHAGFRTPLNAVVPRLLASVAPHTLLAVAYLVGRAWWLPVSPASFEVHPGERVLLVLESFGRYFELTFWPHDLSLGRALLGASAARTPEADLAFAGLGFVGLALLGGTAWFVRRRAPAAALGLLLYVAALLPVSNIVLTGYTVLISPRYLYLPLLGTCLAGSALVAAAPRWLARPWPLVGAVGAVVLAFTWRSVGRSLDFTSEERFWSHEIARNPRYPLAREYFMARELNAGRPRAALTLVRQALDHPSPADLLEAGPNRAALTFALQGALLLTPDLERTNLEAIRRFARDVREARPARLDLPDLELRITVASDHPKGVRLSPWLLLLVEAEVASRLGDDAFATETVRALSERCNECWTLFERAALIAARAGDPKLGGSFARALHGYRPEPAARLTATMAELENLRAPAGEGLRLPVRAARYYSAVGAWGRAYEAAAPVLAEPERLDPGAVLNLGELVLRAGDHPLAQRLFARAVPAERALELQERILLDMHLRDRPRPANEPLPSFLPLTGE